MRSLPLGKGGGENLALRFAQLSIAHGLAPHLFNRGIQQCGRLIHVSRGAEYGEVIDETSILAQIFPLSGIHRLATAHHHIMQPAVIAARHDGGKHLKRGRISVIGRWRLPHRRNHRQGDIRRGGMHSAGFRQAGLLARHHNRHRIFAARNISEILIHQLAQAIHFEIARHNQRGCVRPIKCLMECARIIQRCRIQILY